MTETNTAPVNYWNSPLKGKKALVVGVANDRSIAWSIAQQLAALGAEVGFTYQGENLERRVRPLAESLGSTMLLSLDVTNESAIDAVVATLKDKWGKCDILIHSVAFAERSDLEGRFVDTPLSGFQKALEVSCYSLVSLSRKIEPLMVDGGSIITLSYLGANRVVKNYNVMGVAKAALEASVRYLACDLGPKKIRVNSVSAGPVKTLAAAGIKNFKEMLSSNEARTLLGENISQDDVGAYAAFLCTPGGAHVTGQNVFVDSGQSVAQL